MLDDSNPITPLQSATILNCLKAMVPQFVAIIAIVTGRTLNVEAIQKIVDSGGIICLCLWTLYYNCRAIRSRINATQTIIKKD